MSGSSGLFRVVSLGLVTESTLQFSYDSLGHDKSSAYDCFKVHHIRLFIILHLESIPLTNLVKSSNLNQMILRLRLTNITRI